MMKLKFGSACLTSCYLFWFNETGAFMYLCVSGTLVVFHETSRFLKDQFLQLLLGKVVQFHGESEGLLCYRLHTNTHFTNL